MKNTPWKSICLAALAGLAPGCGILGPDEAVEVRVRNGSDVVLDQATLYLPIEALVYSDLEPGEETRFVGVTKAYRIASAEVVVGQDTARVHVIDYFGEHPLDPGRYTFIFRVFEGEPLSMGLDFDRDS